MRNPIYFSEVHDVPLQFNFMSFRVSLPVIMILLLDLLLSIAGIVIANQFLSETPLLVVTGIIITIGVVVLFFVMWWVSILSRLSRTLPVEKQLRLLYATAKLPVWTGIEAIDGDKKEQIR